MQVGSKLVLHVTHQKVPVWQNISMSVNQVARHVDTLAG